jgi:hypothetical protein
MIIPKYYCCLSSSLTQKDLLYLASAIDADGSIYARLVPQKESIGIRVDCGMQVSQKTTRRYYLESFEKQTGFGKVRNRKGGQMSDWIVETHTELEQLLKAVLPYLRLKKEQAKLVLLILDVYTKLPKANTEQRRIERAEGIYSILPDIDRVAALNDSSNRDHTGETAFLTMQQKGFLQNKIYKSP